MLTLLEDQLLNEAVSRAELSRISYNLQTEEFRNLNADLETYLGDIKVIDDNNRRLHESIEEIRLNYILIIEDHLKRLPNDFRQQSQTLTEANLERYKLKSRARRFISEREEFKRRINFIAKDEKQQIKHLNILQKQERSVRHEFNKLYEQIQKLSSYVESERKIYQQTISKFDHLQVKLEQICNERSKTEVSDIIETIQQDFIGHIFNFLV